MDEEISRIITKIIFVIIFLSLFSKSKNKEHSLSFLKKDCYENLEAAKKGSILNIFVVIMLFGSITSLFGIVIYIISNSLIITLLSIIVVLYLSLKIIYHNKESYKREDLLVQQQNQLAKQRYEEIQVKWNKNRLINYEEAIKKYPSKHLLGNENEWGEMIEKQADYAEDKNDIYGEELRKEYNLTKEDWEKLKGQYFIESCKISRECVENKSK